MIPCKRPKVTVDPRSSADCAHDANCRVPGCSWTYPADKQFMALKSDADWQASRHRAEHRAAVPNAYLEHAVEWDVYCTPCGGHRRTFGTRTDAQAWLDYHLSTEHGLVSCS